MKSLAGVPQLLKAESGKHGSAQKLHGKRGKDTIVLVPTGTVVSKLIEEHNDSSGGGGGGGGGGIERDEEEEALPEWLQQWKKPWVGADDYDSSDDSDDDGDAENIEKNNNNDENNNARVNPKKATLASCSSSSSSSFSINKEDSNYILLADLIHDGQEIIAAHGGHGGRGNASARSLPNRPAPSTVQPPTPAQTTRLLLELKLIADVALVGLPNVGKSSLLRALSAATPKIGSYAFTTLKPQLGAVELGFGRKLIVADVPGLIEGAHENRGLGHRFLRHVERARALAFVVDASSSSSSSSIETRAGKTAAAAGDSSFSSSSSSSFKKGIALKPWEQLQLVRREVAEYSPQLLDRPWIVVANKIDLLARPGTVLAGLRKKGSAAGAAAVIGVSATGGYDSSTGGHEGSTSPRGIEELVAALENLMSLENE
jgi:GTPase involved in cell partitioning and DNA repair